MKRKYNMKDLENYTLSELKARKQKLRKRTNAIIIGTLIYAAIIFFFMYNDPENDGRLLLLVPIAILWLILTILPQIQRINKLIISKK